MMEWNYLPHQITIADEAEKIIRANALVYLAMEERTGKTGTAINLVERLNPHFILIVTKKRAIPGWEEHLKNLPDLKKRYTVVNYEMLHKVPLNKYQLIIIDESHSNMSMYPKPGVRWKTLKKLCLDKPIIYLSATPSAQSYSQLYHQLALSSWSPWYRFPSFYKWHQVYGIPKSQFISGRTIINYTDTHEDKVKADIDHLTISYKRQDLGFKHEPKDEIHLIPPHPILQKLQKLMEKDRYLPEGNEVLHNINEWIADSPMKYLTGIHQLEGGTLKVNDEESIMLGEEFLVKVKYILDKFGDKKENVIFYHYKQELGLLQKYFKNSRILQATSFAEGVDLSMYDSLIVYSMDFSTARYSQRRARQANINREEEIVVHFILVEKGISEQVYRTVAEKKANFVDSYFEGV